jgi:GNAT superfamily N-acetyltransferase
MDEELQVVHVEKPEESAWEIIGRGLDNYNQQEAGDMQFERLCFAVTSPEGTIVGGVLGEKYWNWLHIDLMWIQEEFRGRGYGHQLLEAIEEEAKKHGVRNIFLDTFSFQAPDFYKQHGYQIFGELPEFPSGSTRFFFTKSI